MTSSKRSTPQPVSPSPGQDDSPPSQANLETKRPTDSVPMTIGTFTTLPAEFGRYRVDKFLGAGMMGAVYLAYDIELDRPVALKIPKTSVSGSAKLLQRFKIEAQALAQVNDRHVCKIYDYGIINDVAYMALEFIDGEELKDYLKREGRQQPLDFTKKVILQVAEGLSAAHATGVLHRDLKPANIMLRKNGDVVITDFGLARRTTAASNAGLTQGATLGSAAYMSPEQANGKPVDARCDVYILGVIFYELLTGEWPFQGGAGQVLGQKCLLDAPSPLSVRPDLPPALAAVCHRMIARKPEDRYANCLEVIEALRGAEQGPGTDEAQPPSPLPSVQRSSSWGGWMRHPHAVPWAILCGAVALLLILTAIVFLPTKQGLLRITIDDPSLSVRFQGETVTVDNQGQSIRVAPTIRQTLQVLQNGVAVESATKEITLQRGEQRLVQISLLDGRVALDGTPVTPLETVPETKTVDPLLRGSLWKGLDVIEHGDDRVTEWECQARITERDTNTFSVQVATRGPNAVTLWLFECLQEEDATRIVKATFNNGLEPDVEKAFISNEVISTGDSLKLRFSQQNDNGVGWHSFRLRRLHPPETIRNFGHFPTPAKHEHQKLRSTAFVSPATIMEQWESFGSIKPELTGLGVKLTGNGSIAGILSPQRDIRRATITMTLSASEDVMAWVGVRCLEESGTIRGPTSSIKGMPDGIHVGHSGRAFDTKELGVANGKVVIPANTEFLLGIDQITSGVWIRVNGKLTSGVSWSEPQAGGVGLFIRKGTLLVHSLSIDTLDAMNYEVTASEILPFETLMNPSFADDLRDWKLEGGAPYFFVMGEPLLHTYGRNREVDTGRVSQRFRVPATAKSLNFEIGGGAQQDLLRVALHADNQIVRQATGRNSNSPHPVEWDLTELRGQTVLLEILDHSTGPWGFIHVHHLRLESTGTGPAPVK